MVKLATLAIVVWLAAFGCSESKCADGLTCQGSEQGASDAGGTGGTTTMAEGGAAEPSETGGKSVGGSSAPTAGKAGATGSAGKGGTGPMIECPPECFRPITCVKVCGGTPVSSGCCPCVEPAFDDLQCGAGGAGP